MKLEIYAGRTFSADFVVVSDDGVTGEILVAGDSGTFTLSTNGLAPECVIANAPLTIVDAANGVFNLFLSADQTKDLTQVVGFQEDKYNTISNYTGFLDFDLAAGARQAKCDIYVRTVGICAT